MEMRKTDGGRSSFFLSWTFSSFQATEFTWTILKSKIEMTVVVKLDTIWFNCIRWSFAEFINHKTILFFPSSLINLDYKEKEVKS